MKLNTKQLEYLEQRVWEIKCKKEEALKQEARKLFPPEHKPLTDEEKLQQVCCNVHHSFRKTDITLDTTIRDAFIFEEMVSTSDTHLAKREAYINEGRRKISNESRALLDKVMLGLESEEILKLLDGFSK